MDYSSLTKAEIQSLLDQHGTEYKSSATKAELISLLEGDVDG
ncbi:HeH/LEM domain-containing protein [Bacillus mobilis]